MQKTLYILRHAKAEAGASNQDDHERALTQRGIDDAKALGEYLRRQHIKPEKVLCSTAMRTRQTCQQLQLATPAEYTDRLYLASANQMLDVIAHTPDSANSVLVIGHNPGVHQLCMQLAKMGDATLLLDLGQRFPTCSFTAIAIDTSWNHISAAKGTLQTFLMPERLTTTH